jgi:hypothetical protein
MRILLEEDCSAIQRFHENSPPRRREFRASNDLLNAPVQLPNSPKRGLREDPHRLSTQAHDEDHPKKAVRTLVSPHRPPPPR